MLRFRRMKTLQKFASVHANVHNHFNLERHLVDRQTYKERRSAALAEWQIAGELGRCAQRPNCIVWRRVRIRLTAPSSGLITKVAVVRCEPLLAEYGCRFVHPLPLAIVQRILDRAEPPREIAA